MDVLKYAQNLVLDYVRALADDKADEIDRDDLTLVSFNTVGMGYQMMFVTDIIENQLYEVFYNADFEIFTVNIYLNCSSRTYKVEDVKEGNDAC